MFRPRHILVFICITSILIILVACKADQKDHIFQDEVIEAPETKTQLTAVPYSGKTYYVSPEGDNSNPGTYDKPWAAPGYATRQLKPGDTLIILDGYYRLSEYGTDILKPASGSQDNWIIIKGEDGKRPVLAGANDLAFTIDLSGTNYIWVENLEITHDSTTSGKASWSRDGIYILEETASHIVLKDLHIHHLDEFGINAQDVYDLQVAGCAIEYNGFGAFGGPEGKSEGLRDVKIIGSSLSYSGHYYQGGDGSKRPYDRPDGFGIEASNGPILIEDTIAAHNCGDGLDSKASNTTISRCIAANNSCDSIKLWGTNSRVENTLIYGRGDGNTEQTPWSPIVIETEDDGAIFELVNITVDDILGKNYLMYVQYDTPDIPVKLSIINSIFRGMGENSPIFIGQSSALEIEYSLFYLPETDSVLIHGDRTYSSDDLEDLGVGNIYSDPLFTSPAWGEEGNYHLQTDSPAIGAGTPEGAPQDDLTGNLRSSSIDLGAYNVQ